MSLLKTIEQLCDVFREADISSQDGRIACWQIIVATLANDCGGDLDVAEHHLAEETAIALLQLRKICSKVEAARAASPQETIQ